MNVVLSRFQERFIPYSLLLTTISVVPWFTTEPINTIKLVFLTLPGIYSLALFFGNLKKICISDRNKTYLLVASILFIFNASLVTIISDTRWRLQFFGNLGRNTGLIFYLSIFFIFIFLLVFSNSNIEHLVIKYLHLSGFFSLLYSVIQYLNFDPINWNNPYGRLIGFQGNPNFQSSFLGLYSILLFHIILLNTYSWKMRLISSLLLIFSQCMIYLSQSIQGTFVFLFGSSFLIISYIRNSKFKALYYPSVIAFIAVTISSIFGLLQKGPLAFLYQPSVSFRGDYWRAGYKMFCDHLFFGNGFSSFGNYYMAYRDLKSLSGIDGRGVDTFSNSPHNIFIEIAVMGGVLLLIPYLFLVFSSFIYYFKSMQKNHNFDPNLCLFASLWFGYLLQSAISVQFVTLGFWGWAFLGIYLNLVIRSLKSKDNLDRERIFNKQSSPKNGSVRLKDTFSLLFIIPGLILAILPLRASISQYESYKSGSLDLIIASAYTEPLDADRMNAMAIVVAKNNRIPEALGILTRASQINPRNHDTWNLISRLTPANSKENIQAQKMFRTLNPLGVEIP